MKILFIAGEASPLVKVGGLADVIGSLSRALTTLGHEIRLVLPKYGSSKADIQDVTTGMLPLEVNFMGRSELATLKTTSLREGVLVYLVENHNYFGSGEVYTGNDLERFLFFSLAVPSILSKLDWRPDIVHCHDWHASLVPLWLKEARSFFPTVFTIHNLAYQGPFDHHFLAASGLSEVWRRYTPNGAPIPPLNFMSQGILLADIITTVSPTYATEILTPEYGEGLDHLLRYRQQTLSGIINGIDYEEYNPADDPYLAATYGSSTLEQRTINKIALQKKANLLESPDVPLVGMVSRLDEQKGFDLLVLAMDSLLSETKAQFVILGRGREHYQDLLHQAEARYPDRLALFIAFDEEVAHLIYGGSDMFLMPSRFEPCGLGQLIALRYGSIPVVRCTGGLADTVEDVDINLGRGNGFVFQAYDSASLIEAVKRAEEAFCDKATWQELMKRNMTLDLSWGISAKKYEDIYHQAMRLFRSARGDN